MSKSGKMPHRFHNTPIELLWTVREKVFGNKHVLGLTKSYKRLPKAPEVAQPVLPLLPDITSLSELYQSGILSLGSFQAAINQFEEHRAIKGPLDKASLEDEQFRNLFIAEPRTCVFPSFFPTLSGSQLYCDLQFSRHMDVLDTVENFTRGFEQLGRETAFSLKYSQPNR